MNRFELTFKAFGEYAILIEWPNRIDENILDDVIQLTQLIKGEEGKILVNYTPGYNSLLLQYNSTIDINQKIHSLQKRYTSIKYRIAYTQKSWNIPVCYEEEYGFDLSNFSRRGLTYKDVIDLHTSKPYRVYMIGFLPGFLYLGGLPAALHMERKENPVLKIPKGSIAIGGEQTGIYPIESPGGWHIIGRTPISLFDLSKKDPMPIKQGDYIHFYAIDKVMFQNLLL